MCSYVLEVSTDYILLISICPLLKGWKLVAKIWCLFAQLYKKFIGYFVLKVSTVDTMSRF